MQKNAKKSAGNELSSSARDISQKIALISGEPIAGLSCQQMRDLLIKIPALVCVLEGPRHLIQLASPSFLHWAGNREILGLTLEEAIPALMRVGMLARLDQVFQSGVAYAGIEIAVQFGGGREKPQRYWFNFNCEAYRDAAGQVAGILFFGYDVTDQVNLGKSTLRVQSPIGNLAETLPQMVWTADHQGNVYYLNNQWFEYTHYGYEALKNAGWQSVIHPLDLASHLLAWKQSLDTLIPYHVELRLMNFKGEFRWHLAHANPQLNEHGTVSLWVGTHTDIHTQKMESETLHHQVVEQLRADHVKDEFISMVAHELKTPVTSIKCYTQLLLLKFTTSGDREAESFMGKMDHHINKLTGLIDGLLDQRKVHNGKLNFNNGPFDFNDLVHEMVLNAQLTTRRITIVPILELSFVFFGDRNRIGQVIFHLLSNAIKFSPKSDQILITTTLMEGQMKLSVQDFGIGISLEHQPHVFEEFFKATGKNQETYAGLGLGLFIADEIIKRHLGSFSVSSQIGLGSTFSLFLPLVNHTTNGLAA